MFNLTGVLNLIVPSQRVNRSLDDLNRRLERGTKTARTFSEAVALRGESFAAFAIASTLVTKFTFALAKGVKDAIRFESELAKIAQTTNRTVKAVAQYSDEMRQVALSTGVSNVKIAETVRILAQAGISFRNATTAAKSIAKTDLLATFDSIESTTEGVIAIMSQFGTTAREVENSLSAINVASKKSAVESEDLIDAVKRTGGVFASLGGNLNELIALFTTVRETTRESAETIATGFRTIFARVQRPKAIQFFRELGIELVNLDGQIKAPLQAIQAIAEGLEAKGIRQGSVLFGRVVEQLGGLRQVSRTIPLLTRFGETTKNLNEILANTGGIGEDVAKQQETLAFRIDQTRQNFVNLISEVFESKSFQNFASFLLNITNSVIELARALKDLIPILLAISTIRLGSAFASVARRTLGVAPFLGSGRGNFDPVLRNSGGSVPGKGDTDTVPAMLTPGEFVINAKSARKIGYANLEKINKFNKGGVVGFQAGGTVGDFAGGFAAELATFSIFGSVLAKLGTSVKDQIKSSRQLSKTFDSMRSGIAANAAAMQKETFQRKIAAQPLLDRAERGITRGRAIESAALESAAGKTARLKELQIAQQTVPTKLSDVRSKLGAARAQSANSPVFNPRGKFIAGSLASEIKDLERQEKLLVTRISNINKTIKSVDASLLEDIDRADFGRRQIRGAEALRERGNNLSGSRSEDFLIRQRSNRNASEFITSRGGVVNPRSFRGGGIRGFGGAIKDRTSNLAARVGPTGVTAGLAALGVAVAATTTVFNKLNEAQEKLIQAAIEEGDVKEAVAIEQERQLASERKTTVLGATATGAAAGAAIGFFGGGVGALPGAIIGGLVGLIGSLAATLVSEVPRLATTYLIDPLIQSLNFITGDLFDIQTFAEANAKSIKEVEKAATDQREANKSTASLASAQQQINLKLLQSFSQLNVAVEQASKISRLGEVIDGITSGKASIGLSSASASGNAGATLAIGQLLGTQSAAREAASFDQAITDIRKQEKLVAAGAGNGGISQGQFEQNIKTIAQSVGVATSDVVGGDLDTIVQDIKKAAEEIKGPLVEATQQAEAAFNSYFSVVEKAADAQNAYNNSLLALSETQISAQKDLAGLSAFSETGSQIARRQPLEPLNSARLRGSLVQTARASRQAGFGAQVSERRGDALGAARASTAFNALQIQVKNQVELLKQDSRIRQQLIDNIKEQLSLEQQRAGSLKDVGLAIGLGGSEESSQAREQAQLAQRVASTFQTGGSSAAIGVLQGSTESLSEAQSVLSLLPAEISQAIERAAVQRAGISVGGAVGRDINNVGVTGFTVAGEQLVLQLQEQFTQQRDNEIALLAVEAENLMLLKDSALLFSQSLGNIQAFFTGFGNQLQTIVQGLTDANITMTMAPTNVVVTLNTPQGFQQLTNQMQQQVREEVGRQLLGLQQGQI